MGIAVADNFNLQSKKPLDNRNQFATLALMKAVTDANIYEGCEAYCVETDKYYKFLSSNTVDASTGKWRERESGGSGGTTDYPDLTNKPKINNVELSGNKTSDELGVPIQVKTLPTPSAEWDGKIVIYGTHRPTIKDPYQGNLYECVNLGNDQYEWRNTVYLALNRDVNISNPTNGQALIYNNSTGKWVNGAVSADTSDCYKTGDSAFTDLADGDYVPVYDTSATTKKRTLWSNIKSVLKSYFDTLYDLNKADIPMYATSSTTAITVAKVATVLRGTFSLVAGAKVTVKFTYANTATNPTLNIGSTGAKNIKYIASDGTVTTPTSWWGAGDVVTFIYDGTQFLMQPTLSMGGSGGTLVGHIGRSDILSTTEKVVGCSTDGKPIYQKTFTGTLPTGSNTDFYIDVGTIQNLDELTKTFGYVKWYDTSTVYGWMAFPETDGRSISGSATTVTFAVYSVVNTITINMKGAGVGVFKGQPYVLTVQYTKTTDSANSFNFSDANDYSTTEKIVGTWIDGSKLYQKTVDFGALGNNTTAQKAHGISNLKYIVEMKGMIYRTDTTSFYPLARPSTYGGYSSTPENLLKGQIEPTADATYIYIGTGSDRTNCKAYVTLRYTKTTE